MYENLLAGKYTVFQNKRRGDSMDSKRAKEILNQTRNNIQVLYNGSPVWIENVNSNNTAEVTDLNNHMRLEAPVNKLVEVNPVKKF